MHRRKRPIWAAGLCLAVCAPVLAQDPARDSAPDRPHPTNLDETQDPAKDGPQEPPAAKPQEPAQPPAQPKPTIEDLEKRLKELEEKNQDDLDDMRFQIETLEKEIAAAKAAAMQKGGTSNNVFNPQITLFANILAQWNDATVYLDDDINNEIIQDNINLREVELDLRAPIDPWADGVVVVSYESEIPNEYTVDIEEGYFTLKKLPFLDTAPGGLQLTAGRFRTQFGRFNKIHLHDLPQVNYPGSLQTFLGHEGYIQNGVSGQFFLPSPSDDSTLQATIQALDGGDIPVDPNDEGSSFALLGHLSWFNELSDTQTLELGASGWGEDAQHQLYGLDATYKWKPLAGGEWHSFLLGGELYAAALDEPGLASNPFGFYVWSQYQFTANTYFGVIYDHTESVEDSSLTTDTFGAYLTYYTTEFLYFRLGAQHAESDLAAIGDRDSIFLEMNVVFGSHPVEPYWVNR